MTKRELVEALRGVGDDDDEVCIDTADGLAVGVDGVDTRNSGDIFLLPSLPLLLYEPPRAA